MKLRSKPSDRGGLNEALVVEETEAFHETRHPLHKDHHPAPSEDNGNTEPPSLFLHDISRNSSSLVQMADQQTQKKYIRLLGSFYPATVFQMMMSIFLTRTFLL